MISEKDITEAEEQEKLSAETYLKGIIDFFKWTSTVGAAAVLWIGTTLSGMSGWHRYLGVFGLLVLITSLGVAIFAVRRVLTAWAVEWKQAIELHSFYMMKKFKTLEPEKVSKEKEIEFVKRLVSATEAVKKVSDSQGFDVWVTWHLVLLMAGLVIYVFAQTLGG